MAKSRKSASGEATSTLRIIGGTHRGRKLPILHLSGLRPTGDRTRETLFNWLQFELPGLRVLDLFAGTGALGLEALSRGADEAVFVEPQAMAAKGIESSLSLLKQSNGQVIIQTAEQYLLQTTQPFDLVFVDPPFDLDCWASILDTLASSLLLTSNAFVYVECPKHQAFDVPDVFTSLNDKTSGKVRFRLLQKT